MTIAWYDWNKVGIGIVTATEKFNDYTLPKGYVNASQVCEAENKEWHNYSRYPSTRHYFKTVSDDLKMPLYDDFDQKQALIVTITSHKVPMECRGVWIHPDIAVDLGAWISDYFAKWLTQQIKTVQSLVEITPKAPEKPLVQGDLVPLESKEAVELAKALSDLAYAKRNQTIPAGLFPSLQRSILYSFGFRYDGTLPEPEEISSWLIRNIHITNDETDVVLKGKLYAVYCKYMEKLNFSEFVPERREWSEKVREILTSKTEWIPCSPNAKSNGERCFRGFILTSEIT